MKRIYLTLALVLLAAMLCAEPTVTNVNASQRTDGSQKVDIYYDLSNSVGGPMTVWLMGSNDNGSSWNMPCSTVSGAIGRNVYAGTNKHIVWNAAVDFPNTSCANFKFRVIAFGGDIPPIPEEFVYINGGTFNMGGRAVSLSSYMIGTFEITQGQWQTVMGSNPASGYGVGSDYPVYYVSWYAILKYCNLRSMAEGLTPCYSISGSTNPANWGEVPTSRNDAWDAVICDWTANGYRLPTEAEWEYAARGGSETPNYVYAGSNDIDLVAWYDGNSGGSTHPVGQKLPNGLVIFDMSGNVWEWCWDWYGSYSGGGQINPTGPESGSSRVLRGGCWYLNAAGCRVASRNNSSPYYGRINYGFRLCRAAN